MNYCLYYQAHVDPPRGWILTAILRSYEHVAFDRTIDKERSIFEFFVPVDTEPYFLAAIKQLEDAGIVSGLVKMENRLLQEDRLKNS